MPRPRKPFVSVEVEKRRKEGRDRYYSKVADGSRLEYLLQKRYGISTTDFNLLLEAQAGVCAICSRGTNGHGRLHVDHDHITGKVRGLLCFSCNHGLGQLQDSPELLRKAAMYIEKQD